jgi:hypothetical protein
VFVSNVLVLADFSFSPFFLLSPSLRMDHGLIIVSFVYFTGGWLVQLADAGLTGMLALPEAPCGVNGWNVVVGTLGALVGEPLEVLLERDVLPIRIFSTVKLEIVLLVGVLCDCVSLCVTTDVW